MVQTLWNADDDDLGGVTGREVGLMIHVFFVGLPLGSLLAEQPIVDVDKNGSLPDMPDDCASFLDNALGYVESSAEKREWWFR